LNISKHDDFLFFCTVNSKFSLIKIIQITSVNLQFTKSIFIFVKSLHHVWIDDCFVLFHC
jgi:hypothetical protein